MNDHIGLRVKSEIADWFLEKQQFLRFCHLDENGRIISFICKIVNLLLFSGKDDGESTLDGEADSQG